MKKIYSLPITVEFEDVDSYRIAHHTKFVAYLERARVHFLTSLGLDLYNEGISIVLYSLEMRFKSPARLLDILTVQVSVESVDDFRLGLNYKIYKEKRILVRASTGIAFISDENQAIIPIPEKFYSVIKPYL
jgi:YbgC/YbaW family acyl-CoA thioester hydrolase